MSHKKDDNEWIDLEDGSGMQVSATNPLLIRYKPTIINTNNSRECIVVTTSSDGSNNHTIPDNALFNNIGKIVVPRGYLYSPPQITLNADEVKEADLTPEERANAATECVLAGHKPTDGDGMYLATDPKKCAKICLRCRAVYWDWR